jgi:hypothetical protein
MASFKVKIGGRDVTFQSEDDFARAMAAMERMDEAPGKNGKSPRNVATAKAYDAVQATREFLEELVNHPNGVHSSTISEALKCDPKGIGRRLLEVDSVLKPLGFKRDTVYDNSKRLAEGGRMYLPGPNAHAAWEAVKRKAGSG